MKNKLIVALDFADAQQTKSFLATVGSDIEWVKVGMELFYAEGRDIVSFLKDKGYKVFLDLKLHDIPNTVEKATKNLLDMSVDMLNFHAAGGSKMLQAVGNLKHDNTLFIGVTQLTSTSESQMQTEQLIQKTLKESVMHYTKLSMDSGMNGVVCSPLEVQSIKELYPKCVTVCPGIRMDVSNLQDQVRVTTPRQAIEFGADFIVVGRDITQAKDPKRNIEEIYKNMGKK